MILHIISFPNALILVMKRKPIYKGIDNLLRIIMVKALEAGNLIHTRLIMGTGVNKEKEEVMTRIVPMLLDMVSC